MRDIDPDAPPLPPHWRPNPQQLIIEDFIYEYAFVPVSTISLVTDKIVKVSFKHYIADCDALQLMIIYKADYFAIENFKITPMRNAVAALNDFAKAWTQAGTVSEADWSRLRGLEFQEALRLRENLAKKLEGSACVLCEDFKDHVRFPCRSHIDGQTQNDISTLCYTVR